MKCPFCGATDSRVSETRDSDQATRRRRECVACGRRFTTYERLAPALLVTKRDGRREEFDPEKLKEGLRKACAKRPVSSETVERLAQEVQDTILGYGRLEVPSKVIGDLVMQRLRDIDEIAYVRFASVYLPFSDLESIRREIDEMIRQRDNVEV